MNKEILFKKIKNIIVVSIGCFIAGFGISGFFTDQHIMAGGLTGLAIALNAITGMSVSNIIYLANIPLLIICWIFLGKEIFFKTIYASYLLPFAISIFEPFHSFTNNHLLAAIFGGVLTGIGLGMAYLGDASTGGTAIPVQIINKYTPLSIGAAMIIIDGLVTLFGFYVFSKDTILYSLIALFIISKVIDYVQLGFNPAKNVLIISNKSEEIRQYILNEISRGTTVIPVKGGLKGNDKQMLMCVLASNEYFNLQKGILNIDDKAFVVVMPANEVLGRGFSLWKYAKDEVE